MNPLFEELTNKKWQQKQLMRFMKKYNCVFPRELLQLFSMAQFVRNRLLAPIGRSNRTVSRMEYSRYIFIRICSMKFGLRLSPQLITRGRSELINPQDIIKLQISVSFPSQFLEISHYGPAVLLGNISAIAEMCYRLSKITICDRPFDNIFKRLLVQLIEYGIEHKCSDCIGMMAYFLNIGLNSIVKMDKIQSLKLAGQSAEAGSVYGWFVLASLLKENSDHMSFNDEFDDGIYIDESDLGVRQFVRPSLSLDEQICQILEEYGCENCNSQFYDGKEKCRDCDFDFDVFNNYSDDTFVSRLEQMRIAVEIFYKILRENPQSHPICIDTRNNLVKIYKSGEQLFGGSVEATDEEIRRLEEI